MHACIQVYTFLEHRHIPGLCVASHLLAFTSLPAASLATCAPPAPATLQNMEKAASQELQINPACVFAEGDDRSRHNRCSAGGALGGHDEGDEAERHVADGESSRAQQEQVHGGL